MVVVMIVLGAGAGAGVCVGACVGAVVGCCCGSGFGCCCNWLLNAFAVAVGDVAGNYCCCCCFSLSLSLLSSCVMSCRSRWAVDSQVFRLRLASRHPQIFTSLSFCLALLVSFTLFLCLQGMCQTRNKPNKSGSPLPLQKDSKHFGNPQTQHRHTDRHTPVFDPLSLTCT